ncbi:phosphoribosylanthranilate isomerase [Muriicola jejuensis]|uniref:N-(5'-phosphoribosyl)anthranilate isomerase n=1 Tax=Muriicola jejuensis TaxID=504488 RepID=A0A6P0U9M8_9FLAO|nr:phosphoribosylanthranilate isomerase [Muriicola jejuensis]NER09220.1 phosphoribosylanthranilate isomerase [Muriicola jejuensis]SMP10164.1 phosphoribosylanthranilate isomerase [Muriicola jejuensis]
MKIKVCGMKFPENMQEVASLRPDYLGFIFWEPSPRYFSGSLPELPDHIRKVGVFVDAPIPYILEKTRDHSLDMIQLHGDESPDFCISLKEELSTVIEHEKGRKGPTGVVKAFAVDKSFSFDSLRSYEPGVDYFLFDSKGPLPGGNGFAFDWSLLEGYTLNTPFFLSGGIGMAETENLRHFLKTPLAEKCHAIDVNSGFEVRPGLKDPSRLQTFIKKIM